MSGFYKGRMLRAFARQPLSIRYFTEGEHGLAIAPRHVQHYIAEMVADGLIEQRPGDALGPLYAATAAGIAEATKPTSVAAGGRLVVGMGGDYTGPRWNIRAGAESHKQHLSRGLI